jgi:signal transduction histidine kinase
VLARLTAPPIPRRLAAYAIAFAATVAVEVLKVQLERAYAADLGFVLAFLVLVPIAILMGPGPATLSLATITVIEATSVLDPLGSFAVDGTVERVRLLLFILGGLVTITLSTFVQRARENAEAVSRAATEGRLQLEEALSENRLARADAEAGQRRLEVIVRVGQVLGASLDIDETLRSLAAVTIPSLCDVCIVDVLRPDGPVRFVAAAPGIDEASAHAAQDYPVDLGSPNPIATVIRTGRSVIATVDDALLVRVAQSERHLAAIRALGLARILVVPLQLRDRAIGALLLGSRDASVGFTEADLPVAEVIGQRAAKAVENALLHQEVRRLAVVERERAAELGSVLSAIGEGIVIFAHDGSVRSMNDAATRMLRGDVRDEAMLRDRLVDPASAPRLAGTTYGPWEIQLEGSPRRWLELSGYALDGTSAGDVGASVVIVRDVTAFREGQQLREAFLSLLSHELRTPITSIYAGASVLGGRWETLEPDTRSGILDDVVAESDHLFRLIEDLMVLARFDEGMAIMEEPALLQRVVPTVIDAEQRRWPDVRFTLEVVPDLRAVSGDETSIKQVVRNLLSNAAKYSTGGTRDVLVTLAAEEDGVTIRVLDRGAGLSDDTLTHLFTPFFRAPSTAAVASGAGIGLYVCHRLVDAMGGRMWARRREGGGSEFGFWLPDYDEPLD